MSSLTTTSVPTSEAELDELLSTPSPGVAEVLSQTDGNIVILGAGGKIGPSMALMARKALDSIGSDKQVIAVSRFSDPHSRSLMESAGVVVHPADLSNPDVYADLPDAGALYYLAAMKFGTSDQEHLTWWSNASIPTMVANRYRGIPTVVYSTGNVYPLRSLSQGGAVETDPPAPVGEYAQSSLARERIFTNAAYTWGTPITIFRLNYACELRYGVIADIATQVLAGEPVDVTMPAVNVVWQGDVNAWALRSLELSSTPPHILNATGPETVPVRRLAHWLAEDFGSSLTLQGQESEDALLSDASHCFETYGYPTVPLRRLVRWIAAWVADGGRQLGKATKFEQREGKF